MTDIKVFDRWSVEGVVVADLGLQKYITLKPRLMPKSGAKYAKHKFHKSATFIVERMMNKIMIPGHRAKKHKTSSGHNTGKSQKVTNIMIKTLEILENKMKKNPLQILVTAIENAAPREEIIAIEYGGARYPKAVDCAPQRRIDVALRQMTEGAAQKAFRTKKHIYEALADEILNAYGASANSAAIAKKNELERQADSSR